MHGSSDLGGTWASKRRRKGNHKAHDNRHLRRRQRARQRQL